jgi:hypothetical protein
MKQRMAFLLVVVLMAGLITVAIVFRYGVDPGGTGQTAERCRVLDVRQAKLGSSTGNREVEYRVILSDGSERVVTQEPRPGEPGLARGEKCQLQTERNGRQRVSFYEPPPDASGQHRQVAPSPDDRVARCRVLQWREVLIRKGGNDLSGDGELAVEKGVEYYILLADGSEHAVFQPLHPSNQILKTGENCRLWFHPDGSQLVLPVE